MCTKFQYYIGNVAGVNREFEPKSSAELEEYTFFSSE